MKLHEVADSGAPAVSRMAVAPPVNVTVYCVLAANVGPGFKIHWLVVPLRLTVAVTSASVAVLRSWNVVVSTPSTASLNVADTLAVRLIPVALPAGARWITVGATLAVVKLHDVVANGAPAVSRMAVAPPVNVTVYCVPAARFDDGFNTHVFVEPLRNTVAVTNADVWVLRSWNVFTPTPFTASLNVAVTLAATPKSVTSANGTFAVNVGGALTEKAA